MLQHVAGSRWPPGISFAAVVVSALAISACSHGGATSDTTDRTVNVYSWAFFIAPDTVANFERETGIKVRYDTFESDELLEARLLAGRTQYDVVVPTDIFFERELRLGAFRKLDRAALPNLRNLDPEIMRMLAAHDPGNQYGVPYAWSTTGIGYNVDEVRKRLGISEVSSWSLLFDPNNAAQLQSCGISFVDSPTDVIAIALMFRGKDPNSRDEADLAQAAEVLMRIRPFIRSIVSVGNIVGLSNGEICAVLGWSGDMVQARYRAAESGNGIRLRYVVPREGSLVGIDTLTIPADAPHPRNAELWLNYLMRPDVIAAVTNAVKFPNGNAASLPFIADEVRTDQEIYPTPETRAVLRTLTTMAPADARRVNRLWTKFRAGH